ncbi:ABATE domain-containing protein [Achromobacter xylosoxidans]
MCCRGGHAWRPGLRELALQLRESARSLLQAAKSGGDSDASVVNHVLKAGGAATELAWTAPASPSRRSGRAVWTTRPACSSLLPEPSSNC